MGALLMAPPAPRAIEVASIAEDVELWLRTQPRPAPVVRWRPRGGTPLSVRDREHLAELLAALDSVGAWGVVDRPQVGRWGQSMRVRDGWIVEVNGIPGPECFARRVRTATGESLASAGAAADVLWSWLRGLLPAGCELREVIDGVE